MIVRRVEMLDTAQIAEIYNHGIQDRNATFETELRNEDMIRSWLTDHFGKKEPVLVGISSKESKESRHEDPLILGWTLASSYRSRSCYSGIDEFSVYVRKGYRRHGIGEKLLLSLIDDVRLSRSSFPRI